MMKAEPVADVTRNTHNYFAQGGNELVIGGKLTFLPGAVVEGLADLLNIPEDSMPYTLPSATADALGGLFMHFMLGTILAARLMNIDPLDQPAVEEGKKLARAYLAAGEAP